MYFFKLSSGNNPFMPYSMDDSGSCVVFDMAGIPTKSQSFCAVPDGPITLVARLKKAFKEVETDTR